MSQQVGATRWASQTAQGLASYAEALGLPRPVGEATDKLLRNLGGDPDAVRLRYAEYAMIHRALCECGEATTFRRVAVMWTQMGRDGVLVAARVRRRHERRGLVGRTGPCRARFGADENLRAECACSRCIERLIAELERYAGRVAYTASRKHLISYDDARGELALLLYDALVSWPGTGGFARWFGACARVHFRRLGENDHHTRRLQRLDDRRMAS